MDRKLADALVRALSRDRRLFRYFKDRYAPMILAYALPGETKIADIKRSRYGRLLDKEPAKALAATCGDGTLRAADLAYVWGENALDYTLGFGVWGSDEPSRWRWRQTSRRGWNLVMRLNFSRAHDEVYRTIDQGGADWFVCRSHPVDTAAGGRNTLAWARIDLDAETGEALIEEVQSDWLRWAGASYARAKAEVADKRPHAAVLRQRLEKRVTAAAMCAYYEKALAAHAPLWAEATLAAAIGLLVETIGVRTIYMHAPETGARLKRIEGDLPPRSLYSDLPRRFCFEQTTEAPAFLLRGAGRPEKRILNGDEARFWRHRF